MTEITILAVSRISDGVCVAGVTDDGQWIRPTRPNRNDSWRQLEFDDCKDNKGHWIIRKGNRVRMHLIKQISYQNHSEDWLIGDQKPQLVNKLSEDDYQALCKEFTENSLDAINCKDAKRSLTLIHPSEVISFSFAEEMNRKGQRKYVPRCSFKLGSHNPLLKDIGVSDSEWRGYGRQLMREHGVNCSLQASEIFEQNSTKDCWFTVGGNPLSSSFYFLIVGIHLFPPMHFEMDFQRR